MLNIYKPEVFQGSLDKKNYFEGWYFKHVTADLKNSWSFIPGISLNEKDPHSFIQILNGTSGESEYLTYPVSQFSWRRDKLYIRVGNSVFTDTYMNLDIKNTGGSGIKVSGLVEYMEPSRFPRKLLSPGIMGWYSFVPYMECKHGIVSANHLLKGKLKIGEQLIDFSGGKGYIEKDWGTSFPESWLWIHANNFNDKGTSFFFSVAKIPWRGKFFIGFICFLYYEGKYHLFCTYNKAKLTEIRRNGSAVFIVLSNKKNTIKINASARKQGELKAPVSGSMTRRIKESNDAIVSIAFSDNKSDEIIYTDTSRRGGIELIEKIFEYL